MESQRKGVHPGWIIGGVTALLGVACCVGVVGWGAMRVQETIQSEGGVEGAARAFARDAAGDSAVVSERFFLEAFAGEAPDAAWDRTSDAFRGATDRAGYDRLITGIERVMGKFESAQIRHFNKQSLLGQGTTNTLTYDAVFEKGPATIIMALHIEDGVPRVQRFNVQSPRFQAAMLGEDLDADADAPETVHREETDAEMDEPEPQER